MSESFTYEKTCSRETTRDFLKTEKKGRIDFQCIM